MTDRELLELAARAEGRTLKYMTQIVEGREPETFIACWNPLTDDGDAFRLAVKLKLEIYHAWDEVNQVCVGYPNVGKERTNISYVIDSYKDANISEATRRAVVRAAAEIGKAKP